MAYGRPSRHRPPTGLEEEARDLKARSADTPAKAEMDAHSSWRGETRRASTNGHASCFHEARSTSRTSLPSTSATNSPMPKDEQEIVGGDVEVVQEPGEAPKLSRTMSKKVPIRPPPLFLDWPDVTQEAQRGYDVINACNYANKYLGTTDHAMECECSEEWGEYTPKHVSSGSSSRADGVPRCCYTDQSCLRRRL